MRTLGKNNKLYRILWLCGGLLLVLAGVLVGLFCGWLACLLWQRFAAWRGLEA